MSPASIYEHCMMQTIPYGLGPTREALNTSCSQVGHKSYLIIILCVGSINFYISKESKSRQTFS